MKALLSLGLALAAALQPWTLRAADPIPNRPEKLAFPPLRFEPPNPADYRVALSSGLIAYLVPNRELPLVQITVLVRTGKYVEPEGKEGLSSLAGYLLSRGGAGSRDAQQLDERLDFLAAQLSTSVAETQGSASLNLLTKDLDEGLSILRDVLASPRFQEDRLTLRREQLLQEMRQRNDDSSSIEARERLFLAYGDAFWASKQSTSNAVTSITRADLETFHRRWFHPANFVVAASGDFDRQDMSARLEKLFAQWPFQGDKALPVPGDGRMSPPGAYLVDKDVNQGRVLIFLPGITRENPDFFPVTVMNDILGGGGFTSRIMNRVRSDEGLAYSAFSSFTGGVYYPLQFIAGFQSKSRTVTYAASIVLDEMSKMARELVGEDELETSRRSFIDTFPRSFANKAQVASIFAQDEFTGRYQKEPDYWKQYRNRIAKVTTDDVRRVAGRYLDTNQVRILIVGQREEILKGHPDHAVRLDQLAGGKVNHVPLRDPLTMKPVAAP
ncbi:MAG: insulinase family protein [Verrucomicrobia bacterium]|nr:insulinase family protein [Verrucomicrobiota bacterium]